MKVAFILKYFLPEHVAGTEVYVAALCKGLLKLGIDAFIIKPGYNIHNTQQYFYEGIRVVEYPESSVVDKKLITGGRKPEGLTAFEKVLKYEAPDCIHFHEISGSNGITIHHVRIANSLKIPVFTTLHLPGYVCKTGTFRYKNKFSCSGVIDPYKCSVCLLHSRGIKYGVGEILSLVGKGLVDRGINLDILSSKASALLSYPSYIERHRSLLEELFSVSEKVFILSDWFKVVLLNNKLPESKIELLPKAIPFSKNEIGKPSKKIEESTIVRFVYVGRITEIKGLHIALEAFKEIESNEWSLDIYGPTSEESYYKRCEEIAKGIEAGKVSWMGVIKPSEVVDILHGYNALIFPTVSEEMVGLVAQEAFASKVPVIGSNVRGISEQVQNGVNGLLFESGSVRSLSKVLNKVLTDRSSLNLLAKNIKDTTEFGIVAARTLNTYKSILRNYTAFL